MDYHKKIGKIFLGDYSRFTFGYNWLSIRCIGCACPVPPIYFVFDGGVGGWVGGVMTLGEQLLGSAVI